MNGEDYNRGTREEWQKARDSVRAARAEDKGAVAIAICKKLLAESPKNQKVAQKSSSGAQ